MSNDSNDFIGSDQNRTEFKNSDPKVTGSFPSCAMTLQVVTCREVVSVPALIKVAIASSILPLILEVITV